MNLKLLIAGSLVAAFASAPVRANLVVNGDFETPILQGYSTFASIPGWTGTPAIELQNHVAGSPYSGNNLVELDADFNSGMFQDIATVAGHAYTITFAYSARPGVAASSNGIDFLWNGALVQNIAESGTTLSDTAWSVFTFTEMATGASSRIGFAATGTSDSLGGYLDLVTANGVVPEPATWSLFGLGAIVTGLSRRRRVR